MPFFLEIKASVLFPVVVAVERTYTHPKYLKVLKARSKYMAHDELDEFKVFLPCRVIRMRVDVFCSFLNFARNFLYVPCGH